MPPSSDQNGLPRAVPRSASTPSADLEAAYHRYQPALHRFFAERVGPNPDRVADLCQQTWTLVWQLLTQGRYDPQRAALSTFIFAVANNLRRREQQRRTHLALDEAPEPAVDDDLAEVIAEAEMLQRMKSAALPKSRGGVLSDEEFKVVTGFAAGETERGLAARLHLAGSTIHARKLSAFQKLREFLGGSAGKSAEQRPSE